LKIIEQRCLAIYSSTSLWCYSQPSESPKSIAFDDNPMAPDNDFIMSGKEVDFQTGLDAQKKS
jgi:Na+-transporting NADH:ubiquinone oxidoreductase subunit A